MPIGIVHNSAGKPRPVMDCRPLTNWTPSPAVKYEMLMEFAMGIDEGAQMFSMDHKSG
jgi:hypothetical protein